MERRLAAILAADVVGYSRLMAGDEAGTFARLKTHRRELIEPTTFQYHRRAAKLMASRGGLRGCGARSRRHRLRLGHAH